MAELFILLILFQIKHFVCDYPLQGSYMLGKFKGGWEWVFPLASHALVHGFATMAISFCFTDIKSSVLFGLADYGIHFTVDRIKAHPRIGGRFKPNQPYFWWCLGADQMAHHLTHYAIISKIIGFV